ncbi:YadA-like family protein [Haemophilus sp. SZY H8]|uniref:YadA-like family protein n=1 Tax=Haemophilus sp. SZY H8 TaxID=2839031 RepID=UPI001C043E63|nr:YadA-like family protein [Haemophilus sp. SZY H8]
MNNIFKVIWNHATQTWTAVGELASAKGKSKSVKLAAISTALLAVVAGGAQAANVVTKAEDRGGLAIGTDTVTNQFYGNADYKAKTGLSENKAEAKVNAYDGIAIGNGALSGSNSGTAGNAHIAIGLMSQATGNFANGKDTGGANAQNAAVALGAYSLARGQGSTALGAHAVADEVDSTAVGKVANAKGQSSTAVGQQAEAIQRATATGAQSKALGTYSTAMGQSATANSWDSITVGSASKVSGQGSVNVGSNSVLSGKNIAAVGADSKISSNNVSTLGSNITVAAGRDGAVVLGHGSDAGKESTKVMAVNSAVADGSPLVYSDFAGKLGGTDTDGTNKEATGKQGNVVSVGSKGNERQIKHVAAGQITADSTDAINGSQLYQVAKTLGTAANQTANALGVTLNKDGTLSGFSQPLTIAEGSNYTAPPAAGDVKTALTNLNNYVNAGWNITASGNGYKNNVSIGHTVNFVGLGNVDVDGVDEENGVRTINISTDSPIDYASTTFDGKPVTKASDGKWYQVDENGDIKGDPIDASEIDKKGAKLTDSDTENNPYEKGNSYTYDDKGNITETGYDKTKPESKDKITAGEHGVQLSNVGWATQPDQAVNKDQLDQTVNKSGFYVQQNGKSTLDAKTGSDKVSDTEKVTPNDVVNFADGDGTIVKVKTVRDDKGVDTTTVSVDVDKGSIKVDETNLGKVAVDSNPTSTETQANADAREGKKLATVKNVVDAINNAGFVVSNGESNKSELINAGKKLTLKGGNGVNVEQDGSNFTFSIDSSKLLEGKTGDITVDKDKKAGEDGAGKAAVNDNDATKLATVKNVADAINGAKWFAKVENLSDSMNVRTQNDKDADAQAMGAGDILTLKADKNLAVKREGKDVTYGLASTIEVDKITVKSKTPGEATTTFENGKVTNLDDHLTAPDKVTGGNVVNATEVKTPTLKDAQKKEAATVNDVLNAGWNLKTNGNQTAAITNGKGLDFASDDNSVTITPTVDKDGNAKVNFSVNATNAINGVKGNVTAAKVDGDQAGKVTVSDADKGKLATVDTVAEAINSAATFVKVADSQEVIKKSTDDDNGVAVKSGDTVTHTAGKNLKVKRDGKSITYALAQDIDVNSVTIGSGDNATKITSDDKGLNLAGKDGAATNINNVKDADLNSTSKQAVNGSQLYATNEKVANLGTTVNNLSKVINHHAGAIDSLDRKVNKHSKQARAGIAGANAAAALPQAYTQGKAMVAAAAGTFKGQNALAVGYSRISDNGKVILKLQGNANTSGDVGAGVGVGYQW